MAGKRKIELFVEVNNSRDFEHLLNRNKNLLICAEIYCSAFGSCTALDHLFTTIKLDWSNGQILLLKVLADEIEALERFKNQSEPFFMFIVNKKITQVFRGVDCMRFAEVAKREIFIFQQGLVIDRPTYNLDEATPEEINWHKARADERAAELSVILARQATRQAARKKHRAELIAPHLQTINFVLYWPHAKHAHPELYERWDLNNIIMVGREELELTEDMGRDILYAGDAAMNEASMHALVSGKALAICFRLLDEDQHFVSLVRRILYKDMPPIDESKPMDEQPPQKTAFDLYKSYSPTRDEVWRKRRADRQRRKEELTEKRARRLSEMQRMARQEIEDRLQTRKMEKENKKLELLRSGNLAELEKLRAEPEDDDTSIIIPEELPEGIVEELSSSEEEDENEYFPPPGLLIPAFYAPPNDVAKANGLAVLFPKLVAEKVTPEPEFLPPHVLVLLQVTKRHKAIDALAKHYRAVIHMGIFQGSSPYKSEHIAFTVKQYDAMDVPALTEVTIRIAFMMSVSSDIPLLQLMDLSPEHVSRDPAAGDEECAALFPVTYGDGYPQFEDFEDP